MHIRTASKLLITLVIASCATGSWAQDNPVTTPVDPVSIISNLSDRLYVVGETDPKLSKFQEAVREAAAQMEAYAATAGPDGLTVKTDRGFSLLTLAVEGGYADVVEVLLRDPAVRATINERDSDGFTPWITASFAFGAAPWVCNPNVLNTPQRWVPSYVKLPYYRGDGETAYTRTRRLLEAAGATPDKTGARDLYLSFCRNVSPEGRARITAAADPLVAIEAESATMMENLAKKTQ